jgi:hypothetical protein
MCSPFQFGGGGIDILQTFLVVSTDADIDLDLGGCLYYWFIYLQV